MKRIRFASVLGALALLSACDLTGGGSKSNTTPSPSQTDAVGDAAIKNLGTKEAATDSALSAMQNGVPSEVGGHMSAAARQNLLDANATYRSQLASNPDDGVAGFGVAVSGLSLKLDEISDKLKEFQDAGLMSGNGSVFKSSPTALVANDAFAGRKLSDPKNAPKISELQNLLETKLMPSVDSAIYFLDKCWKTPDFAYRFAVHFNGEVDSLTIGRADVGFALAGLRTAKAYFTWILAQNIDCDFNGSYAWIDTLGNIDGDIGPSTTAQQQAFQNLQSLLSPGSAFLTIRSGHQEAVNAIPAELISVSQLAKEAGDYSVLHQITLRQGLVRLSREDNADFAKVMDSVKYYLGGMRTYVRPPHTENKYSYDSICTYGSAPYTYSYTCGRYKSVSYPGFSITFDVSKAITQPDHKVFLPKFTWNNTNWATKGFFNLQKGSVITPIKDFDNLNINSPKDMVPYIEWDDPTFGGIFAFKSSADVLNQLESMNRDVFFGNSGSNPPIDPLTPVL